MANGIYIKRLADETITQIAVNTDANHVPNKLTVLTNMGRILQGTSVYTGGDLAFYWEWYEITPWDGLQ